MKWISIKEEKPAYNVEVLIYASEDMFVATLLENANGDWFTKEGTLLLEDQVSHWQPLPEPHGSIQ